MPLALHRNDGGRTIEITDGTTIGREDVLDKRMSRVQATLHSTDQVERLGAARISIVRSSGQCLADTPLGGNDPKAWKMQFPHVPRVLAELHASGSAIIIVTNESMDRFKKPEAIRAAILKKTGRLEGFAAAAGVPLLALCATAKDTFRKPGTGAYDFVVQHTNRGVTVDRAASFFVGDAAGRPRDHSDCDRAFAAAAGLPFHDEKEFFERMHP